MLGSKGLGINSSCRVGKGGCEDTKTRELSVVRRELNPMLSSETLCRKRSSETADMGMLMLSVGDSRPSKGGWM